MDGQRRPAENAVCTSGLADLVAGALSGVAVVAIGQPLDTVKTKMQTFRGLYAGPTHCLKRTYLAGGVRGLYAGATPAMVASVAENSVLFACYGVCQRAVASVTGAADAKQMDALSNAAAGCAASFFSSVVLCPTELVKIKLQAGRELAEARGRTFSGSARRVTMVPMMMPFALGGRDTPAVRARECESSQNKTVLSTNATDRRCFVVFYQENRGCDVAFFKFFLPVTAVICMTVFKICTIGEFFVYEYKIIGVSYRETLRHRQSSPLENKTKTSIL